MTHFLGPGTMTQDSVPHGSPLDRAWGAVRRRNTQAQYPNWGPLRLAEDPSQRPSSWGNRGSAPVRMSHVCQFHPATQFLEGKAEKCLRGGSPTLLTPRAPAQGPELPSAPQMGR